MPFFPQRYKVPSEHTLCASCCGHPSKLGCTKQDQLSGVDSPPSLLPKKILTVTQAGSHWVKIMEPLHGLGEKGPSNTIQFQVPAMARHVPYRPSALCSVQVLAQVMVEGGSKE